MRWSSADAIIVNGEGYKKIQINDGLNYGVGVTLAPVEGFQLLNLHICKGCKKDRAVCKI